MCTRCCILQHRKCTSLWRGKNVSTHYLAFNLLSIHTCTQGGIKNWTGIKAEEIHILAWCQSPREQHEVSYLEVHGKIPFNAHKDSTSFLFWRMCQEMGCGLIYIPPARLKCQQSEKIVSRPMIWLSPSYFSGLDFPRGSLMRKEEVPLAPWQATQLSIQCLPATKTFVKWAWQFTSMAPERGGIQPSHPWLSLKIPWL